MAADPDPSRLLADVPIQCKEEDRLGRASFAANLAESITKMVGEDSLVFGLCGPWGSGKSSVLEMLLSQFGSTDDPQQPIVFRFNPWWFSGNDQLLQAFLEQLGTVLGRVDTSGRTSVLGDRIRTLGKLLRPVSWIPGAVVAKDVADLLESAGGAARDLAKRGRSQGSYRHGRY
jgi:hypothetical protein